MTDLASLQTTIDAAFDARDTVTEQTVGAVFPVIDHGT